MPTSKWMYHGTEHIPKGGLFFFCISNQIVNSVPHPTHPSLPLHIDNGMLSLGDLLDGDTTSEDDTPKLAANATLPATGGSATTVVQRGDVVPIPVTSVLSGNVSVSSSTRTEESKKRMERLRQQQSERDASALHAYTSLKDVPGVGIPNLSTLTTPPPVPKKKAQKPESSSSSSSSSSGHKRKRSKKRIEDDDSLEEWGVMVADRGTQTFDGVTVDTQTDPHPHVISCRECYKKFYGRDVDVAATGSGCEHGVSDLTGPTNRYSQSGMYVHPAANIHSDPTSQHFLADVVPSMAEHAYPRDLPASAHWKLQLSKIRYMFDKTMQHVAPNVEAAQKILKENEPQKGQMGVAEGAAAATTTTTPAAATPSETEVLRKELADLKTAYTDLAQDQREARVEAEALKAALAKAEGLRSGGGGGSAVPEPSPSRPEAAHQVPPAHHAPYPYPYGYPAYSPYGYPYVCEWFFDGEMHGLKAFLVFFWNRKVVYVVIVLL